MSYCSKSHLKPSTINRTVPLVALASGVAEADLFGQTGLLQETLRLRVDDEAGPLGRRFDDLESYADIDLQTRRGEQAAFHIVPVKRRMEFS